MMLALNTRGGTNQKYDKVPDPRVHNQVRIHTRDEAERASEAFPYPCLYSPIPMLHVSE